MAFEKKKHSKGENAGSQQYFVYPQCFSSYHRQVLISINILAVVCRCFKSGAVLNFYVGYACYKMISKFHKFLQIVLTTQSASVLVQRRPVQIVTLVRHSVLSCVVPAPISFLNFLDNSWLLPETF